MPRLREAGDLRRNLQSLVIQVASVSVLRDLQGYSKRFEVYWNIQGCDFDDLCSEGDLVDVLDLRSREISWRFQLSSKEIQVLGVKPRFSLNLAIGSLRYRSWVVELDNRVTFVEGLEVPVGCSSSDTVQRGVLVLFIPSDPDRDNDSVTIAWHCSPRLYTHGTSGDIVPTIVTYITVEGWAAMMCAKRVVGHLAHIKDNLIKSCAYLSHPTEMGNKARETDEAPLFATSLENLVENDGSNIKVEVMLDGVK
ncbi:hypothetical protein L6452_03561 [Arctium lappa]|uniref:Uncharacterized protein n=1 Tax=Arctium lappa TaxID=4217 RepID=A0ACB9FNS2_ARCLA|nr:hypothetical protein L6452_03561 [Arctium lappa]